MNIPIGKRTIVGWAVSAAAFLPIIIKLLENANHLGEPQKVAALVGMITFAITHLGGYGQAIVKAKQP